MNDSLQAQGARFPQVDAAAPVFTPPATSASHGSGGGNGGSRGVGGGEERITTPQTMEKLEADLQVGGVEGVNSMGMTLWLTNLWMRVVVLTCSCGSVSFHERARVFHFSFVVHCSTVDETSLPAVRGDSGVVYHRPATTDHSMSQVSSRMLIEPATIIDLVFYEKFGVTECINRLLRKHLATGNPLVQPSSPFSGETVRPWLL